MKRKERTTNNLMTYLQEITNIPLLSREEELRIAREAANGNPAARERLVSSNLRFVVSIAKKYQGMGLPLEDLISEGNTGLLNAVDRFDVDKGCHFISYAVWWIRQAIMVAIHEKSKTIRLPVNRISERDKYETISLDNHVSNEKSEVQDATLVDFIEDKQYASPYNTTEYKLMEADIDSALKTLKKEEAEIIRCHFGLGRRAMTLKEIGMHYNLSKERIRQIEERALARLRNPKRMKKLQAYVA